MKKWLLSARSFKNAHNFQGPFGGTLWDYQHQIIKQFSSNARRCFKALNLLGIFWQLQVTPQQSTEIPRPWFFSIKKHNWWMVERCTGDPGCNALPKLMAGMVMTCKATYATLPQSWWLERLQFFTLQTRISGAKFLLSCKFSITSSHHLLFKKKKCPLSLPGGPLPYKIAERVASGSNWATSIRVTFYLASGGIAGHFRCWLQKL